MRWEAVNKRAQSESGKCTQHRVHQCVSVLLLSVCALLMLHTLGELALKINSCGCQENKSEHRVGRPPFSSRCGALETENASEGSQKKKAKANFQNSPGFFGHNYVN